MFQRLKLNSDGLLPKFAFNFNLRRYIGGEEPRLLPAAAFNASLMAALEETPDLVRQVRRRTSDGALTASFMHTRAIPVASDYALQLDIYKETVMLDKNINNQYFGAGVEGLEAGKLSAFSYQDQLVFWQGPMDSARHVIKRILGLMDSARYVIKQCFNPRCLSQMASHDVASTIHLMDSARHIIKLILNPRLLSQMSSYDVASTIHESLHSGSRTRICGTS